MHFSIPNHILYALNRLNACGFEAYLVGGCVRDDLLGIRPFDYDIASSAMPEETIGCFKQHKTVLTGLKHGTVSVIIEGKPVEITTFRIDGDYDDKRHPNDVFFTRNLAEDLKRRDFTVNALAFSPQSGIIDQGGGLSDLKHRIIRCVGDPEKRFEEDALRILRALRFACTLDFHIEANSEQAMLKRLDSLANISTERITLELNKFMMGKSPELFFRNYPRLFFRIIPGIESMYRCPQKSIYHCYDVWEHTLETLSHCPKQLNIRWAALFHDSGKPGTISYDEDGTNHFAGHEALSVKIAEEAFSSMRQKNSLKNSVSTLIRYHDERMHKKSVQYWLAKLGAEDFFDLMALQKADILAHAPHIARDADKIDLLVETAKELIAQNAVLNPSQLNINGRILLENGFPQGPLLREILSALFKLVLKGEIPNDGETLLRYALTHFPRN